MSVTKGRCVRVRVLYRGVDMWARGGKSQLQMLYKDKSGRYFVPFNYKKVECTLTDRRSVELLRGGIELARNAHRDGADRALWPVMQSELPEQNNGVGTAKNGPVGVADALDTLDQEIDAGKDIEAQIALAAKLRSRSSVTAAFETARMPRAAPRSNGRRAR